MDDDINLVSIECKNNIDKDFLITKKQLGKGQFGKVMLGINRKTDVHVAIKIIKRENFEKIGASITTETIEKKFIRETHIMKLLNHPHIIKYYGCYKDDKKFYIVMEIIKYGDLFGLIKTSGNLDEDQVKRILVQIISAIEYCHGNLITHRDIKLENILINNKDNIIIKLSDFGLSTYININSFQKTFCGSVHYAAPEIINGTAYNPFKTDIWSMGVVLYSLLTGKYPWRDSCLNDTITDIIGFKYKNEEYNDLSIGAKDLLSKIFVSEEERILLGDIKKHPWLENYILPSYLEIRPNVYDIDCFIVNKIMSLGFVKESVLCSVFDNKNTIENALYHLLRNKYNKIRIDNNIKFVRKVSYSNDVMESPRTVEKKNNLFTKLTSKLHLHKEQLKEQGMGIDDLDIMEFPMEFIKKYGSEKN